MIFYSSLVSLQARCSRTRDAASKWLFPLWWTVMREKKEYWIKHIWLSVWDVEPFLFASFFHHLNNPPLGKIKILTMLLFVITLCEWKWKRNSFIHRHSAVAPTEKWSRCLMLWATLTQGFVCHHSIYKYFSCLSSPREWCVSKICFHEFPSVISKSNKHQMILTRVVSYWVELVIIFSFLSISMLASMLSSQILIVFHWMKMHKIE